jgi:uncharacterized protein (TIGR02598 family)
MKPVSFTSGRSEKQGGFSLVEATFSIGLLSFGFLALAPLLAVGIKSARLARDDRATAQIAQTLIEDAKQGSLPASPIYLDDQGNACSFSAATFSAQTTSSSLAPSLSRLTIQVTPVGAPDRARIYAVVLQTPQ